MDPKSRKSRINELFKNNEVSKTDVAKHLGVSLRYLEDQLRKPCVNSLKLIKAINVVSDGRLSLEWLISGAGPKQVVYLIKSKPRTKIKQRVKYVLDEAEIPMLEYSKILKRDRNSLTLSLNFSDDDYPLYNIIAVHLLTGASFDYLINGVEPVYISRKAENFSLVDYIELVH